MRLFFQCFSSMYIVTAALTAVTAFAQDITAPDLLVVDPASPSVDIAMDVTSFCTEPVHHMAEDLSICPERTSISRKPNVAPLLRLHATAALVIDQRHWRPLYAKEAQTIHSIASITKLMT